MMIFIICMIYIVLFIIANIICYAKNKESLIDASWGEWWETPAWFFTIATIGASIVAGVCLLGLGVNYIDKNVELTKLQTTRDMLVYRIENEDNFLEDAQLKKEVMEFNVEIRTGKAGLDNIWIGWFYSPAYKEIEEIEVK